VELETSTTLRSQPERRHRRLRGPADIAAIRSRLSPPAYLYQEVSCGAGEPITPDEYVGNGDVLEFRYGTHLPKIFNTERLASLRMFTRPG
jgi:alpha-amylase